jgi:ADP-heptose:LPS heptosyltransferase
LTSPRHLLIFRFSSLGDVAMTVPVIQLLLKQYPQLQVTVVSTSFVKPLFAHTERLHFIAADLKRKNKGFQGLFRLYKALKKQVPYDAVADFHNVLRTKVLRGFMVLDGKPIAVLDKGRTEKKELTRAQHKILKPLKTTFERYADVLAQLQLPVQLNVNEGLLPKPVGEKETAALREMQLVGIAPFAQYERKMYPLEKMKEVVKMLLQHGNLKIYLFGGRAEATVLQQWEAELPGVINCAGKMSFEEELQLIAQLDVMVSMDSANMHLASMYGVPVVSVWGATHPFAGFYGWGQNPHNAVQVDLYCRPCSVFGNKQGPRDDLACMHSISPLMVYQKIAAQLAQSHEAAINF